MFKIRHKLTGKFSKGGADVDFDGLDSQGWAVQAGKVWTKIGHVRNHINMVIEYRKKVPIDWEIVEYETIIKKVDPVSDHVNMIKLLKAQTRHGY